MKYLFMSDKSGAIIALAAAASVLLLGLTAVVTDIGFIYYNQARLQTAVNASWKAGYDRMLKINQEKGHITEEDQAEIRNHVLEIMKANGYSEQDLSTVEVTFSQNNNLHIADSKPVGLFFARIFDYNSFDVNAQRLNHQLDTGQGILPIGIPHGVIRDISGTRYDRDLFDANEEFVVDREYILKLGKDDDEFAGDIMPWGVVPMSEDIGFGYGLDFGYQQGVEYEIKQSPGGSGLLTPGNFGALNLNPTFGQGGGANNYKNNILNGYSHEVNTGEQYYPETGNIAGPTVDATNHRINEGLTNIKIPVVSGFGNGSSSPSTILGFLNFKLIQTGVEGQGANAKASVIAEYLGRSPVSEEGYPKHKFGPLDPDNHAGGSQDDYLNRFKHGYSAPIELDDRLMADDGNKKDDTEAAVEFRINGTNSFEPNRRVILPITDIGPEVAENNPLNELAETIYDLQGLDDPQGLYHPGDSGYNFGSSVQVTGFAEFELVSPENYVREGDNYGEGDTGDLGHHRPGQVRGKFVRYIIKPGSM